MRKHGKKGDYRGYKQSRQMLDRQGEMADTEKREKKNVKLTEWDLEKYQGKFLEPLKLGSVLDSAMGETAISPWS